MRMFAFLFVVLAHLVLAGCGNQPGISESEASLTKPGLEIRKSCLASGWNHWYDIWGGRIRVMRDFDSTNDSDAKILYDAPLTEKQQEDLQKCLSEVPLHELKGWYEKPDMVDGFFLEFRIPDGRNLQRIIRSSNYCQPDLMRLTACIDSMLPEDLRIDYLYGWP